MVEERIKNLKELEKILSYSFKNIDLLDTALTHSSYANENPDLITNDNERLEFLGDAVLQLGMSDILTKRFPEYSEGKLSKIRASMVNEQPLAILARKLKIGDHILLGKGEEISGGRNKNSILADAFEAILAAIYIDRGFERVLAFINSHFQPCPNESIKDLFYHDSKSSLQEFSQNRFKTMPLYKLIAESGPDHDKTFEVQVLIEEVVTAKGKGKSKKEAEQEAARQALVKLEAYSSIDKEP